MPALAKRYKAAVALIDRAKAYTVEEAIATLKQTPGTKFDESVDLAFHLGVDPKHADQMVRGAVVLPHGTGKTVRVVVFAKGGKVEFRVDKAGNVHVLIGKKSFSAEQLAANAMTLVEAIMRARPASAKGQYLKSLTVSSTMGPGIPVDVQRIANLFKK